MPVTTKMTFMKSLNVSPVVKPSRRKSSSRVKEHLKAPPTPISSVAGNQIRFNPAHTYPYFDFASYVQRRSYTLSTIHFGNFTGASFLEDGVHDILVRLLSQMPPSISISPTSEVRDAREKGLGVFATSFIPPGGLIFDEHPAILAPYLLSVSVPLAETYIELFESLPKSSFALATSLATSHQDDVKPKSASSPPALPPPSFYEDILQTNSVAINLLVPTDGPHPELATHRALFLRLSRCNHSCDPNAVWSWDAQTLTLILSALRPISPGEEITISYITLSGDHAAQREELRALCGFDCTCEECTLPSYVAVSSARNVVLDNSAEFTPVIPGAYCSGRDESTLIGDLPTFEEWYQDSALPDTMLIDGHKNALYRIEQQRLASSYLEVSETGLQPIPFGASAQQMDQHVELIAMCYGALGDVAKFRKWIAITKEASTRPEHKVVFNRWLSNPSSFPLWGKRKRKIV